MSERLASASNRIGDALRYWRQFRRLSQLDLALRAEVSARHLSFVETGRAQPGRALIARLCEELEIPLRERNAMLLGAGFSPSFGAAKLDDPEFETIRSVMALTLERQKPYPGFVIDRHWNVLMSNAAIPALYEGVAPKLLQGQINVVRLVLHPEGMAPRVQNLSVWRSYYARRLRRQIELTSDPVLIQLLQEVHSYPALRAHDEVAPTMGPAIPLIVDTRAGQLSFISATTVFGSPVDVNLEELAMELLHPANTFTEKAAHRL